MSERIVDVITAIDVVLLPPDYTELISKQINQKLTEKITTPESFKFDDSHYPHITLFQAYVKETSLSKIYERLERMACHYHSDNLSITLKAISVSDVIFGNNTVALLNFQNNNDIIHLQKNVSSIMNDYRIGLDGNKNCFYKEEKEVDISQRSIDYVANFSKLNSQDKYAPHITLGISSLNTTQSIKGNLDFVKSIVSFPFSDQAHTIAIFQLGNICTCRKLLWKEKLSSKGFEKKL